MMGKLLFRLFKKWIASVLLLILGYSSACASDTIDIQSRDPKRIIHFVLRGVTPERASWIVSEAKEAGFNAVQVVVTDGIKLEHSVWMPRADAWSKKEFFGWVETTKSLGFEIIPELKLLTHQEKFFQNSYLGLMFNQSTYDPRIEDTYKHVSALLDEVIAIIQPKAIHIGHDEVAGWVFKRRLLPDIRVGKLPDAQEMLPADLYLQDILKLHEYLRTKGVETWMWGDMLISPAEFPDMFARHLHGTVSGYGKPIRDKLPRDIVICDWHYFDAQDKFPSLESMKKEGFRVIGATWKEESTINNFSRYAANHGAYGMMATTWFHVQKKEWEVVDNIIKVSGETFVKDFPDAR